MCSAKTPSSWLLRLFDSEFFSPQLALCYLHRNPDSPGIHCEITRKLAQFPDCDIEFLLPQICHMLLATKSAYIENFLIALCSRNSHLALLTLWLLEAYISSHGGEHQLAVRVYYTCRSIVFTQFTDKQPLILGRDSTRDSVVNSRLNNIPSPLQLLDNQSLKKESSASKMSNTSLMHAVHTESAIAAIGCIAAAFSHPGVTKVSREMLLVQATQPRNLSIGLFDFKMAPKRPIDLAGHFRTSSPSISELSEGRAFSFKKFISDSNRASLIMASQTPSSEFDQPHRDISLMKSHHYYSEMRFIMTLVDISDRLRTLPKHARQASLIAELALLNHNLPANVYIPFRVARTHRVARIVLSDCVILNSADRVPFLMMVEVIENEEIESGKSFKYQSDETPAVHVLANSQALCSTLNKDGMVAPGNIENEIRVADYSISIEALNTNGEQFFISESETIEHPEKSINFDQTSNLIQESRIVDVDNCQEHINFENVGESILGTSVVENTKPPLNPAKINIKVGGAPRRFSPFNFRRIQILFSRIAK